jgi:CBS domain-containing protein
MGKNVRDAMTSDPTGVDASTPIAEVAQRMKQEDVGSIPIIEGGKLTGIVTDRDITVQVVAAGKDPQSTTAGEVASKNLVTIDPQRDLDEALRLMAQHQVRRLPVVEEDGRLVGMLAQADVAQHADEERVGETVEQISE